MYVYIVIIFKRLIGKNWKMYTHIDLRAGTTPVLHMARSRACTAYARIKLLAGFDIHRAKMGDTTGNDTASQNTELPETPQENGMETDQE